MENNFEIMFISHEDLDDLDNNRYVRTYISDIIYFAQFLIYEDFSKMTSETFNNSVAIINNLFRELKELQKEGYDELEYYPMLVGELRILSELNRDKSIKVVSEDVLNIKNSR